MDVKLGYAIFQTKDNRRSLSHLQTVKGDSPFSLQCWGHLGSGKFQSRRTKIQILKAVNCKKKVWAGKKQKDLVSGLWDNGKTNRRRKFVAWLVGKRVREKIIQRVYLHILKGTSVKTKQQPKVRKGEKISAEKYALCCIRRHLLFYLDPACL